MSEKFTPKALRAFMQDLKDGIHDEPPLPYFPVIMSPYQMERLRKAGLIRGDGTIIGQYAMGAPIKIVPNGPIRGLEGTDFIIDEATVLEDESFRQEYMAEFVRTEE